MSDRIVIGVDNGLDGGLCALAASDCSVVAYTAMPTVTVGDKREIDVLSMVDWSVALGYPITVCIEEPLKHAKSSQAMRSMGISFGQIDGAFKVVGVTPHRIQVSEWQSVVLGKRVAKGQTKTIALQKAQEQWPQATWLATARSRVPHDGIVDAALLARFFIQHRTL